MMEKCLKEKVCKQERWDWQTWVFIMEARSWKAEEDRSPRLLVKMCWRDLKVTLEVPPTAFVAATVVMTVELSNDAAVSHNSHIIGIFHQRWVNLPNKIRRIIARCPTAIVASKQTGVNCYQELKDYTWYLGNRRILAKEQIIRIY